MALNTQTYIGEPCRNGHDGERYSSTGMCVGCSRAWYERNKEKKRQDYLDTKDQNKEYKRERARKYYLKNKERILASQKAYYEQNKDKWPAKDHKRRAKGLPTHWRVADIRKLKELQQNKCPVCKIELAKHHIDHIVPLSKGGTNEFGNIQLLCPTCNLNKHAKDPVDFMQSKGYLL